MEEGGEKEGEVRTRRGGEEVEKRYRRMGRKKVKRNGFIRGKKRDEKKRIV